MEYTWDLVTLYKKMKGSGSTNTRFTNREGNKMFSDIFTIKRTRIFKAIKWDFYVCNYSK